MWPSAPAGGSTTLAPSSPVGQWGGQEAGGPQGRAGAVAQLVTGLVTSRQTQDGWVLESK